MGAREHDGMTTRGMNYWESADGREQRLIFAMNSLLAGGRRHNRQVEHVRSAPTVSSTCASGSTAAIRRASATSSRAFPARSSNLVIVGSAPARLHVAAGRHPRVRRGHGTLAWTFHTVPRPGEFGYDTWPKEAVEIHRRREQLGRDDGRHAPRHRLHPARVADV
jgi:quinoprotein glucose dehydrogenase